MQKNWCNFFSNHSRATVFIVKFLFLHCHWQKFPFPATTMEGAEWAYILPCRRIWNKLVTISETRGEGKERKQSKLCLASNIISVFTKQKPTNFSVRETLLVLNFTIVKKVICSGIVLNRIQSFIASWSTFMNLIGSFPPPSPQDYFRNPCVFSEFSLEGWILCLNLNQLFPFMVWAPSLQVLT